MRTFSDTDRTTSPGSSNASSEYSLLSALDGLALSDRSSGSIETVESLESVESAASTAATLSDTSETSDDYELILIPSSGSSSTSVIPLSSSSGRRSSRRRTTDSDDDWQSVSDTSEGTERPSHTRTAPSTLSASDAQASIDSFFTDAATFMGDKANKLRLWQSLCIEFGLVELEGSLAPSLPDLPGSDTSDDTSSSSSRSSTPRPLLPPLPQSLTQAHLLLKAKAHVNIAQYIAARGDASRHTTPDAVGKYADLVYPSATAMMRDTRKKRQFHPIGQAKLEWLNPLLKTFRPRYT